MSQSRSLTDPSRVDELLSRLRRREKGVRQRPVSDARRPAAPATGAPAEGFTDLPFDTGVPRERLRNEAPTNPAANPVAEPQGRPRAPSLPTRAVPPPETWPPPSAAASPGSVTPASEDAQNADRINERFASSDVIEAAKMRALERARRIAAATGDGPGERVTDNVASADPVASEMALPVEEPADAVASTAPAPGSGIPDAVPPKVEDDAPAEPAPLQEEAAPQTQRGTPTRESISTLTLPRVDTDGDFQRQLDKLLSTLMGAFEATGAFIADRSGLPLSLRNVGDEAVARSSLAWHLFEEAGKRDAADLLLVRRDDEPNTYIYLVTSGLGPIAVAIRCETPVTPQLAELTRRALAQALHVDR